MPVLPPLALVAEGSRNALPPSTSRRHTRAMATRRILAWLLAAAIVSGACSAAEPAPNTTTTVTTTTSTRAPGTTTLAPAPPEPEWTPQPEWAVPLIDYLDAYRQVVNGGDARAVFPFLADYVNWWHGEPDGRLRVGIRESLVSVMDLDPVIRLPGHVFFTWAPFDEDHLGFFVEWIHEVETPGGWCPGDSDCDEVQDVRLEVGPHGVAEHLVRSTTAALRRTGRADEAGLDRIEGRYAEIAMALSSHDPEEAASIMSDVPTYMPGEDGTLVRVNPRESFALMMEARTAESPESVMEPMTLAEAGIADDDAPALFFTPPEFVFWWGPSTLGGMGLYRLTLAPDEDPMVIAVEWIERERGLISLEILFEPFDTRALVGDAPIPMIDDPSLWPPLPDIARSVTGTVPTAGGREVIIFNGSPAQEALVAWGLEQFDEAGLSLPEPRSVGFPPDFNCVLYAGLALDTGEGVELQLCFDESEVCVGDACTPTLAARSTLLHELGHVWTTQYVDDGTRAAFLETRGLEEWSGPGLARDVSGTEHAAEIIAWGLLVEETWQARLPDNECADLVAAFRVLTGQSPLRTCET